MVAQRKQGHQRGWRWHRLPAKPRFFFFASVNVNNLNWHFQPPQWEIQLISKFIFNLLAPARLSLPLAAASTIPVPKTNRTRATAAGVRYTFLCRRSCLTNSQIVVLTTLQLQCLAIRNSSCFINFKVILSDCSRAKQERLRQHVQNSWWCQAHMPVTLCSFSCNAPCAAPPREW